MKEYIEREKALSEIERFVGYGDEKMLYRIKKATQAIPAANMVNKNDFIREIVDYLNSHASLEHGDVKFGFEKAIAAVVLMPTEPMFPTNMSGTKCEPCKPTKPECGNCEYIKDSDDE